MSVILLIFKVPLASHRREMAIAEPARQANLILKANVRHD